MWRCEKEDLINDWSMALLGTSFCFNLRSVAVKLTPRVAEKPMVSSSAINEHQQLVQTDQGETIVLHSFLKPKISSFKWKYGSTKLSVKSELWQLQQRFVHVVVHAETAAKRDPSKPLHIGHKREASGTRFLHSFLKVIHCSLIHALDPQDPSTTCHTKQSPHWMRMYQNTPRAVAAGTWAKMTTSFNEFWKSWVLDLMICFAYHSIILYLPDQLGWDGKRNPGILPGKRGNHITTTSTKYVPVWSSSFQSAHWPLASIVAQCLRLQHQAVLDVHTAS